MDMLVLTRRVGEVLKIGDTIKVRVLAINGNQVRIGIDAPKEIVILREELKPLEEARNGTRK